MEKIINVVTRDEVLKALLELAGALDSGDTLKANAFQITLIYNTAAAWGEIRIHTDGTQAPGFYTLPKAIVPRIAALFPKIPTDGTVTMDINPHPSTTVRCIADLLEDEPKEE